MDILWHKENKNLHKICINSIPCYTFICDNCLIVVMSKTQNLQTLDICELFLNIFMVLCDTILHIRLEFDDFDVSRLTNNSDR